MEYIKLLQLSQLLQKLIRIKSLSGQENKLSQFIMNYCRALDIPAITKNGNVIIRIKGQNHRKALIFNAHMDTVNEGDINKWKYPPFGGKAGMIKDDKTFGLGASDDKAAIAVMLKMAKISALHLPCDVWLTFVTKEETDGSGTKTFIKWFQKSGNFKKYQNLAAIICEPTNLDTIEIGNRGNYFIKIVSTGISGHGALIYDKKDLAVEKMLNLIKILNNAFNQWKKIYHHKILGEPHFNITNISTNNGSINNIPYNCFMTLDIRTTPEIHGKLIKLLKKVLKNNAIIIKISGSSVPCQISPKSVILNILQNILPNVKTSVSFGSTDLSVFLENGIDALVFGPGNKETMHQENEYVEISQLEKSFIIYKRIIAAYG